MLRQNLIVSLSLLASMLLAGCAAQKQTQAPQLTHAPPPVFTPPPVDEPAKDDPDRNYPPPPIFDPSPIFDPKPLDVPLPIFVPPPIQTAAARRANKADHGGKPQLLVKTKVKGITLYKMVIDLDDPQTYITVALPHDAVEANSAQVTHGDEEFPSFVHRYKAALLANGTFFSKDDQKRIMGNLVTEGCFRKYSQWENYGTTFGIKADNELEMVTARKEGQPNWSDYWFSITCGPRLVKAGQVSVDAESEGFQDSHVLTIGPRAAIGFDREKRQIIYAAFLYGLSLEKEAELMKALGCDEAMNLDGGASRALASDGTVLIKAGRPLTNVLVVYDSKHPAPKPVVASWKRFQDGERPVAPN